MGRQRIFTGISIFTFHLVFQQYFARRNENWEMLLLAGILRDTGTGCIAGTISSIFLKSVWWSHVLIWEFVDS